MDIELIVLLSFAIQLFLFFAGRFHLYISDKLLRSIIGIAYLGANTVAVYALGNLSRQEGSTQSIAFLWAPFLLVHLGGNDTITAWTMEDNNLWLRNCFSLVLHVVLAGYTFWKSIGGHNVELLISAIFVFVTGIIKYGEKTWCFKSGSIESLENSTGKHHYKVGNGRSERNGYQPDEEQVALNENEVQPSYSDTVFKALQSMQQVHDIFAACTLSTNVSLSEVQPDEADVLVNVIPGKVVELQLGMIHDDLYTKALVLRTRNGLALRLMSMISAWVAFGLFLASNKRRYNKHEVAISYSLFVGEFFLEFCSVLILMMSPWTWAWLKSRGLNMLAHFSWLLLSSRIGWPEERPRWPTSMGQCNGMHMFVGMYQPQPRSWTPRVMVQFKKFLNLFEVGKEPISWLSNLIHTKYVTVDDEVMKHVMAALHELCGEFLNQVLRLDESDSSYQPLEGPNWHFLGSFLLMVQDVFIMDFGRVLLMLHVVTDVFLSEYRSRALSPEEDTLVKVCTKLSNYMLYLLVNHPSSLPLNTSAVASLKTSSEFLNEISGTEEDATEEQRYNNIKSELLQGVQPTGEAPLYELIQMWTRVLLYAASRMKAKHHAAHLARGGELITIVWLHMAIRGIGDSKLKRFRVTNFAPNDDRSSLMAVYAFNIPQPDTSSEEE